MPRGRLHASPRVVGGPRPARARERRQCATIGGSGSGDDGRARARQRGGAPPRRRPPASVATNHPPQHTLTPPPRPPLLPHPPQEFKPSDFGWHKTKIAQLLTVKRERTLAAGVSKRDARAAEKRDKVAAGFGQF